MAPVRLSRVRVRAEWWKRDSPPAVGAILFALITRNRRGAMGNMERVLAPATRAQVTRTTLQMFANFARCFTHTMEFYGPRPQPIRIDDPRDNPIAAALTAATVPWYRPRTSAIGTSPPKCSARTAVRSV